MRPSPCPLSLVESEEGQGAEGASEGAPRAEAGGSALS